MKKYPYSNLVMSTLMTALSLQGSVVRAGDSESVTDRVMTSFISGNNIEEHCVRAKKLPMGEYSKGDNKEEARLCAINFYDDSVALCPKVWSTSPGTIVKSLEGTKMTSAQAESAHCGKSSDLKTAAKFKQTMNQANTSGTFSMSSILYYHFSRALDTILTVPVAVYRTMDRQEHFKRVTSKAKPAATAKMNVAGWKYVADAESNPSGYNQKMDLLTSDGKQIYGVLLRDKGERYGAEINGTREGAWGVQQSLDFQNTPAFMALKSSLPLKKAIHEGYQQAIKNPKMKAAFASEPSYQQMVLWMNETTEIALLDYIFSQQDRIGNIDYVWYWVYNQTESDGTVTVQYQKVDSAYQSTALAKASRIPVPAELKDLKPQLVQKTSIGDNDAGGLVSYANFAKKSNMPGNIKHMRYDLYQRVLSLANDFEHKGENYRVLESETGDLDKLAFGDKGSARFTQMIKNTQSLAALLRAQCLSKELQLNGQKFETHDKQMLITDAEGEMEFNLSSCELAK